MNRTLIVPPFFQDGRRFRFGDLYDTSSLASPTFCWVDLTVFVATLGRDEKVPAGCMAMQGASVDKIDNPGHVFSCKKVASVKKKKELDHNVRAAVLLHGERVVIMPIAIYLGSLIDTKCIWGRLRPVSRIQKAVDTFRANHLPARYTAVHLRGLEQSCESRSKKFAPDEVTRESIRRQCQMSTDYVLSMVPQNTDHFFLADDGQRPEVTKRLKAKGGVTSGTALRGVEAMLIDFWLLVGAEVFVGNQMSTLSVNVCRVRTGYGKHCDNFLRWNDDYEADDGAVLQLPRQPCESIP
eukprot:Sspe_Gene.111053::Locus_92250_Transcript_1_3_Confidence_0.500_Length_954::g.111053::m.111053